MSLYSGEMIMENDRKRVSNEPIVMMEGDEVCEQVGMVKGETSQKETSKSYRIELNMEEYARLARRALQEGCTVEELVARCVERLLVR